MATAEIEAAIKSIPEKKESLRKALEALRSYSFASFTVEWKDLDDHISAIEKSLQERFKDLQAKEPPRAAGAASSPPEAKTTPAAAEEPEATPRPELKSLCVAMDSRGLRSFLSERRKDFSAVRNELTPAIRAASDPAKLVLDAMEGFYPPKSKGEKDGETQMIRKACVNLLERVQVIAPEIKPAVRVQAKKLAMEWKGKMADSGGENGLEAMGLLQLIVSYSLVSEFEVDEILDLLVIACRRKQTVHLCKSLGFTERIPDLIQKLNSRGKQLDSVKFVYAFQFGGEMSTSTPSESLCNGIQKGRSRNTEEGKQFESITE
ncbi:truncated FRIGIDA-like protein 1 [Phoenix dactylifera]|uniref:FRIGIDA-like protein n=1 Tax=Phoenix dactylifera TaxID=42345 RepID=A0A8B7BLN1_PHODC|nr:truncated FRIGIDA-like protein 1 [Phoenix dactylifera]